MDVWNILEDSLVEISCPDCSIHKRVLMSDILMNRTVICSGCETSIKLIDKDGSGSNARKEIEMMENKIKDLFKNL